MYRTTRYTLPLLFLVIKTNIDYQIVGAFVSENKSLGNITEPLQILKPWNPKFKAKYFMTNYSTEEIRAVKTVFSWSNLLLISFIEFSLLMKSRSYNLELIYSVLII